MRVKPMEVAVVGSKIRTVFRQRAKGFDREVVRTITPADAYAEGMRLLAAAQEAAAVTGEVLGA